MRYELSDSRNYLSRFFDDRVPAAFCLLLMMVVCLVLTVSVGLEGFLTSMQLIAIQVAGVSGMVTR